MEILVFDTSYVQDRKEKNIGKKNFLFWRFFCLALLLLEESFLHFPFPQFFGCWLQDWLLSACFLPGSIWIRDWMGKGFWQGLDW